MKHMWVWHPESPGVPIAVKRGFFARLFRSSKYATPDEVLAYETYQAQFRTRKTTHTKNPEGA